MYILSLIRTRCWNRNGVLFPSDKKEVAFATAMTPGWEKALDIFIQGIPDDKPDDEPGFEDLWDAAADAPRHMRFLDARHNEVPSADDPNMRYVVIDYGDDDGMGSPVLVETYEVRTTDLSWDFRADEENNHPHGPWLVAGVLTDGERFLYWKVTQDDAGREWCSIHNSIAMDDDTEECCYPWTSENDSLVKAALDSLFEADERWCGEDSVLLGIDFEDFPPEERNPDPEMSRKYGLHIFRSENPQFQYFVREWDECYTEDEIKEHIKDWQSIQSLEGGTQ